MSSHNSISYVGSAAAVPWRFRAEQLIHICVSGEGMDERTEVFLEVDADQEINACRSMQWYCNGLMAY